MEYKNLERLYITQSFEYNKQFRYRIKRKPYLYLLNGNNFEYDLSILNYLLNNNYNNNNIIINKEKSNNKDKDKNKKKNSKF